MSSSDVSHQILLARTSYPNSRAHGPLHRLVVDGLDPEAIWGELELQNRPIVQYASRQVKALEVLADSHSLWTGMFDSTGRTNRSTPSQQL